MKNILYICSIALFAMHGNVVAQTPFLTADSIDINNINARLLVHGDMFWDPDSGVSKTFFPKGTTKTNNFVASLWMSGYDGAGKLHVAAQTYRQDENDYWPGPLDNDDTLTYATSQNWAKIWKVNVTDISYFLSMGSHDSASTPASILTWPGAGNTYANGATGPLTFTSGRTYAPFVDLNGDGIYEPLQGEYPDIRGDQALWEVFSDNGATHSQSNGRPLGVEVHLMAYAYLRGTEIDNVIYYNYSIFNYSPNTYDSFRVGFWDDIDLGWYDDDYIGFDSSWRMGIQYNGYNCDGCSAGNPADAYGQWAPQCGISLVNIKFPSNFDSGINIIPAGCFDYYSNDFSVIGHPSNDTAIYNNMHCKNTYGEHYSNDYKGPGTGYRCGPDTAGTPTNYMFTGDPDSTDEWSECICNNLPGDRRFLLSTGDMALLPGAMGQITFAFITTDRDSTNGCPFASFDSIKIYADTAWGFFDRVAASVSNVIATGNDISVYPNPANDILYINTAQSATYEIHDIVGSLMQQGILSVGTNNIDISLFSAGVYILTESSGNGRRTTKKFVKM